MTATAAATAVEAAATMEAATTAVEAAGGCMRLEPTRMHRCAETRPPTRRIRAHGAAVVEASESARSKRGLAVELRAADDGPRRRRTMKLARMKSRRACGLHCRVFTEGRPPCNHVMPMCEGRAM